MALLKILRYPDERLHRVAAKVPEVTDEIRTLVHNMAETMYAAPGIGLAATQVDVHQCVIVIDISDTHDQLHVLINPEITSSSGASDSEEGCLSVPEVFAKVRRADYVLVKALNIHGDQYVLSMSSYPRPVYMKLGCPLWFVSTPIVAVGRPVLTSTPLTVPTGAWQRQRTFRGPR